MPKVVKKKPEAETKLRRIQPERKGKKRWDMVDPTDWKDRRSRRFDMLDAFIKNYGETGANVAGKIISYLDFSSYQEARLVSKTWNNFLSNDRMILLSRLMEGKAYFDGSFLEEFWKENLEYIKSEVDLNYQKMFQIFGKMVTIYVVFDRAEVRNSLVVRNQMVEDKLFSQIEKDVVQEEQFVEWLFEKIGRIEDRHDRIDYIKENYQDTIQGKFWDGRGGS